MLRSGQYDAAISKSAKKLRSNKQKGKEIIVLEEAYQKATNRDKEQIVFLKKEGRPENWDAIFYTYSNMNQRQNQIKPLLPLYIEEQGRNANFDFFNYDDELIQAKKKCNGIFVCACTFPFGKK